MLEKSIEKRLKSEVEKTIIGAACMKWVCPGYSGVPDRMILLPGGKIVFVELKAPGKHERARQEYVHTRLRKLGFTVFSSVDSTVKIREVVRYCREVTGQPDPRLSVASPVIADPRDRLMKRGDRV